MPYQLLLTDDDDVLTCGAALITPIHALSAYHCFYKDIKDGNGKVIGEERVPKEKFIVKGGVFHRDKWVYSESVSCGRHGAV